MKDITVGSINRDLVSYLTGTVFPKGSAAVLLDTGITSVYILVYSPIDGWANWSVDKATFTSGAVASVR